MPSFGGGTGDPIVPGPVPPDTYIAEWCTGAVNLADYCQIVGYPECGFFGVRNDDEIAAGCRVIWSRIQREQVARYLCEAQEEIEDELNYPLMPTWFTNEHRDYKIPIITKWAKVIAGGIRAIDGIEPDAVMDHSADPARVTVTTIITNTDEIKVYYPDSTQDIIPSRIVADGVDATIYIPRCRMVRSDLLDTPEVGLDYDDPSQFQQTVDIMRVYNDVSTQAELVDPHNCNSLCSSGNCSEYTHTACIYTRRGDLGILDVLPATYSAGAWAASSCTRRYTLARLNYYAGLTPITKKLQDAVVRLAHSKMHQDPCGCDPVKGLWNRDQLVPEILSPEQTLCPFGSSNGAWWAWRQVQTVKLRKMGII